MAFFDEFGKKISDASQNTIQKTKNLADTAKLNSMITETEKKVKELYSDLGKQFYSDNIECKDPKYFEVINRITECLNEINLYKEKIERLKNVKKCVKCGSPMLDDELFCAVCGEKYNQNNEASQEKKSLMTSCNVCGKKNASDAMFCVYCGTKINEQKENSTQFETASDVDKDSAENISKE